MSLEPGARVLIEGEKGTFDFQYATHNKDGKLILTFIGGPPGHEAYRSFYEDRVRKIL